MPAQFKNRKNMNFTLHEDFTVPAEWHFSATSHGISTCDTLGRTVKRLAASVSMKNFKNLTLHEDFGVRLNNISLPSAWLEST
jgi:hypothetical protein